MATLATLNITEKNANNSLSVTVKVNVTKEGVFTTTLSKRRCGQATAKHTPTYTATKERQGNLRTNN